MAIKSSDQISIVDVTDGYTVILTNDSYIYPGSVSAAKAGSATTQIIVRRGTELLPASVVLSECTVPSGVTLAKDTDAVTPTVTVTVSTAVTSGGVVKIPVHVEDATIVKEFTYSISFTGATGATGPTGNGVRSTAVTYQAGASGTTAPTGTWSASVPAVSASQYLWTKTVTTYTNSTTSTAYSVGMMGATGPQGPQGSTGAAGNGVRSTVITYQASSNGTTAPTGTWSASIPAVSASQYLWTRTIITYTNNSTSTSYSVGMMGATGPKGPTGAAGADAVTMSVISSNGTIFKNSSISTVLTAHVYRAGAELTAAQIAALGTVRWYKDGGTAAVATGTTYAITAGDVTNKATFVAQLEG